MKTNKPFMRLDCDFLLDPDIQIMMATRGKAMVFDYLGFCAQMIHYKAYRYAIPEACLGYIAGLLMTDIESIKTMICYCIGNGFLQVEENDGQRYYYSIRRRVDLLDMETLQAKRSEAGKRGMATRWPGTESEGKIY